MLGKHVVHFRPIHARGAAVVPLVTPPVALAGFLVDGPVAVRLSQQFGHLFGLASWNVVVVRAVQHVDAVMLQVCRPERSDRQSIHHDEAACEWEILDQARRAACGVTAVRNPTRARVRSLRTCRDTASRGARHVSSHRMPGEIDRARDRDAASLSRFPALPLRRPGQNLPSRSRRVDDWSARPGAASSWGSKRTPAHRFHRGSVTRENNCRRRTFRRATLGEPQCVVLNAAVDVAHERPLMSCLGRPHAQLQRDIVNRDRLRPSQFECTHNRSLSIWGRTPNAVTHLADAQRPDRGQLRDRVGQTITANGHAQVGNGPLCGVHHNRRSPRVRRFADKRSGNVWSPSSKKAFAGGA